MTTEYRHWPFTDAEKRRFSYWMARIMVGHTGGAARQWGSQPSGTEHAPPALGEAVARADRLLQIADGDDMDQFREIVNRITVLELMVGGKHV